MTGKVAFTMKLKSGAADEYKQRHDKVWPEILALLRQHGISDYSIFLDEQTLTLFSVQNVTSATVASNDTLRQSEIMQRWWAYMADLVEFNDDGVPITNPLTLVFHMD